MEGADKSVTEIFKEWLARGSLPYSVCSNCGQKSLPPRRRCSHCGGTNMELRPLDTDKGEIVAVTKIVVAPAGFEDQAPYTLAVVQFKPDLRLFGRLRGAPEASNVGSQVRLMIDTEAREFYFQ